MLDIQKNFNDKMEELGDYIKGYDDMNQPFDVLELKKQIEKLKQDKKNLLQIETKGVETTMKKNCYRRVDGRWQYSK